MPGASAGTSSVSPISQRARSHSSICLSPDASERSTAAPRLIPSVEPVHSGGSGEHIDTKALSEYITDELINSGKVRFVDAANREKILNEIQYQNESGMVSEKTAKRNVAH